MKHTLRSGLFRRLCCCVLTALAVLMTTPLFAQITIDETKKPIRQILKAIEKKSEYRFFYNEDIKDLNKVTTLQVQNASIEKTLDALFLQSNITYQLQPKNNIVLSQKVANSGVHKTSKVTGLVTDQNGDPIQWATVVVPGTNIGTTTDLKGQFSIDAPQGAQISVSYIGMETQTVYANDRKELSIVLQYGANSLEDVVVIGYGAVKKSDLTGAVSSVKTGDLPISSNTSIATMLAGRAAGVTAIQTSAQPGGGVEILIRGAASTGAGNEPLYIIDGFPVGGGGVEPAADNRYSNFGSHNPLNSINPNDIESIEVLKDASSSAIYGARAANGVILITTKKGHEGKVNVTYDGSYGVQQIANEIVMLNATQYMQKANSFAYESWLFNNNAYPYGTKSPSDITTPHTPIYTDPEIKKAGKGTDWYNLITRMGSIQQHNLSVSGGAKNLTYMTSFNVFSQDGVVKGSNFDRISGRVNLEQKIGKSITFGVNGTMSYIKSTNIPLGTEDFENSGLINSALAYDPTIPVKDKKGDYVISPLMATVPNPVSMLEIEDYTKTRRFLVNAYAQAEIVKGLVAKVNLGIDDQEGNRYSYLPKTTLYGKQEGGKASRSQASSFSRLIETTLNYNVTFGEAHKLSLLAGWSAQDFTYEGLAASNSQFFTDSYLYNNLGSGEVKRPYVASNKSYERFQSFFGRVNYNLLDRYLFTVTLRADGSDRFGKNNRYGFFPSAAVAWRIAQEPFMKDISWLSDLKLRAGMGQTGNANIGNNSFEYYSSAWRQYVFGESVSTGTYKSQMGNDDLKWETTTEYNIGLDFGFFDQRLSGSFEFFNKNIDGLLGYRTLKSYMEVGTVAANIGKTQSRGMELTLRSVNFKGKFGWNTEFTFTRYVDRWKERNSGSLNPWQKNDDPIRAYYSYVSDGILQLDETPPGHMPNLLPGQFKVKDMNGFMRDDFGNPVLNAKGSYQYTGKPDGMLDEADIVMMGTTDPGFSLGFGNTFTFNNFDLNIFFYGMFDRIVYNATRDKYSVFELRRILQGQNFIGEVLDSWSSTNTDSDIPSGFVTTYPQPGTFLREPGWFIRCKNISIGYTLPEKLFRGYISKLRFYVDIGNPFVITNYTGNDPETDFKAGYPNQRSYMMGLNISF